jgi:O-antigen ligase
MQDWKTFSPLALFPIVATGISLLVTLTALMLGLSSPYAWAAIIGTAAMAIITVLRQDELLATVVIAVHLYIDWYLAFRVVALVIILVLLLVFFLTRSSRCPWVEPPALWLWGLLLALAIFPAIRGSLSLYDTLFYYPNIFFGAFITFWLGTVLARSPINVHRLFKMLAGLAALLAIHAIIEAVTGITLFGYSTSATHFGDALYYSKELSGIHVYRIGSFFIDPNWNGTFLAVMLFIPVGLFAESPLFWEKVLSLVEMVLILLALLFTFSTGAWIACSAGSIVFILFVGRISYRILTPLFIAIVVLAIVVWFPSQVSFLFQHASDPSELLLRNGAWQTAWRVILAFPLTGVGLGIIGYAQRVEPYRVPEQFVPVTHPHNSYLELGAMAGLPVLITFVAVLLFALWLALRNWAIADIRVRPLFAGGLASVIVLSVNSWSINGWTLPPLAAIGWLILGTVSSPLLAKRKNNKVVEISNYSVWRS